MHVCPSNGGPPFRFLAPVWRQQVESTNSTVKHMLESGTCPGAGFVLAAREQTLGRGRQGRSWTSRPDRDLTFTFAVHVDAVTEKTASLSMAVGLGIAEFLDTLGLSARTKWPNDLLVDGKKICGILMEPQSPASGDGVVLLVGVGLNVNMTAPESCSIDQPATSLLVETGMEHDLERVLHEVLKSIQSWIRRWFESGFDGIRRSWEERCLFVGDMVSVVDGTVERRGVVAGFGENGEMLLREEDGHTRKIWAGDVMRVRHVATGPRCD